MLFAFALAGFGALGLCATTITPVIIEVPSDGRAIVTVRNDRGREVLYQVTVMDWHTVDGVDQYVATQDFIASPPLFTLAPSESQIVRLGFRNPVRQAVEQAYRLVLAEVPRPSDPAREVGVVDFAIQYLLPVFVAPSGHGVKPALRWSMRSEGEALIVRASNPGTTRTALTMVGLSQQPGPHPEADIASKQRVTVLAQAWREWRLPVPANKHGAPWRIVLVLDGSDTPVLVPDVDMWPSSAR